MSVLDDKIAALEAALTRVAASAPRTALASSLGPEDQVLTDVIARLGLAIEVFTLNTGRLHAETLALLQTTQVRYGFRFTVYEPAPSSVLHYVKSYGENAFYDSVELRKACCNIRKVEPLRRALNGRAAWVTGQRREQNVTRSALALEEHDATFGMKKLNPLCDWTGSEVAAYLKRYALPVNALHARGYPSIGCEPCTRAIKDGEDERAGRWWWENAQNKECGLHVQSK